MDDGPFDGIAKPLTGLGMDTVVAPALTGSDALNLNAPVLPWNREDHAARYCAHYRAGARVSIGIPWSFHALNPPSRCATRW